MCSLHWQVHPVALHSVKSVVQYGKHSDELKHEVSPHRGVGLKPRALNPEALLLPSVAARPADAPVVLSGPAAVPWGCGAHVAMTGRHARLPLKG